MVAVIVAVAVALLIAAAFLYGFRGRPNEPPALGSNQPWPDGSKPLPGSEPHIETDQERAVDRLVRRGSSRRH